MVVAELEPSIEPPVAVRRLRPRLSRSLVLARRRDRYFSGAARAFATILDDVAHGRTGAAVEA
jgi:hypothetical protein